MEDRRRSVSNTAEDRASGRGLWAWLCATVWLAVTAQGCVDAQQRARAGDTDAEGDTAAPEVEGPSADAEDSDAAATDAMVSTDGVDVAGDAPDSEVHEPEVTPTCVPACERGTCVADNVCDCPAGFDGPSCGTPICDPPCEGEGTCVAPGACDCPAGRGGARCEHVMCGEDVCPELEGYVTACNGAQHCEYSRAQLTEAWHSDDVWIYVSPSTFQMGAPNAEPGAELEQPMFEVTFARGYLIAKFEVTTRLHEACEKLLGGCTPPNTNDYSMNGWDVNRVAKVRAQHPQNGLTFAQAEKVCAFVGGRLPSSAEWERAAKGAKLHRQFPWGNTPSPICDEHAVFSSGGVGCGQGGTRFVAPTERTKGRSAVGAFDMAGNVMEWVADCWHDGYALAPDDGSAWKSDCVIDATGPFGVARGGSTATENMRASTRMALKAGIRRGDVGVRCAKDAP